MKNVLFLVTMILFIWVTLDNASLRGTIAILAREAAYHQLILESDRVLMNHLLQEANK